MRTFTFLPAAANYIKRHHYAFGEGCRPIYETLTILGHMNATMMQHPAVVGMTFPAWQHIHGYGILKSYVTVKRGKDGLWTVTESTYDPTEFERMVV